jgi:hypothetical protein
MILTAPVLLSSPDCHGAMVAMVNCGHLCHGLCMVLYGAMVAIVPWYHSYNGAMVPDCRAGAMVATGYHGAMVNRLVPWRAH